jgi:site-specific recombinase XerC
VRQYLAWLAVTELEGDPLGSVAGRDWAVRDYRGYLQSVLKRSPATVKGALAAVDDFYIRRGLGPARAKRPEVPSAAPRALSGRAQIRYLRAVQACPSARDRALALVPFYAGTRIAETVALDVDDVRLSARKGVLRVLGKRERVREIPIHPQAAQGAYRVAGRAPRMGRRDRQARAVSEPAWRAVEREGRSRRDHRHRRACRSR